MTTVEFPIWRTTKWVLAAWAALFFVAIGIHLAGVRVPDFPIFLQPFGDVGLIWVGWWLRGRWGTRST